MPGDSLRQRIDEGMARSRFGVVVLSQYFFDKDWPRRELDGLFALDRDLDGRLIPVWHNVSSDYLSRMAPTLAARLGIKSDLGPEYVAREIIGAIRRRDAPTPIDEAVEALIGDYNAISDHEGKVRVPKKIGIVDALMKLAPRVRNVDRYFGQSTEGGRLAFAAILRQAPRRGQLLRLIDTVRSTNHRFVWIEACNAIARYADVCRMTGRERARAVAEIEALRHRRLYERSPAVRKCTENTLAAMRDSEGAMGRQTAG